MNRNCGVRRAIGVAAVILAFAALSGPAAAGQRRAKGPVVKSGSRLFPGTGEIEGLELTARVLSYNGEKFQEYYGSAGNRYIQYGMKNLEVGEYTYRGGENRITIEAAYMENATAAAGIFHYHRGQKLSGRGTPADVGTEGVVDASRKSRTVYFYKGTVFAKVLYGGPEPVPDLLPIARAIAGRIPEGRRSGKPDGFEYLNVEGVNLPSIGVTPGYTFNCDFLPPSVCARAPGAGAEVSDIFVITTRSRNDALKVMRDYGAFLRLTGENHDEYRRGNLEWCRAVDPKQGRVVFTAYKHAVIIVARPKTYEMGEAQIDRVTAKIG